MKKTAKVSVGVDKNKLIKLDLGCGQNKREGFVGVDFVKTNSTDIVHNLFDFPWPFKDDSVEEVHCSHFFEHVPNKIRPLFMNELYRVMIDGAKATFITPYYASFRAIQDYTHEWPPIAEWSYMYFNKGWMKANKLDHYPINCDFDFTYGYILNPEVAGKHQEQRDYAIKFYMNAVADLSVTLTKRPKE